MSPPRVVVFAWFTNHVGGLEQLILTRAKWFLSQGYQVVIVTTDGSMTSKYRNSGAQVVLFSRFENDFIALGEQGLVRKLREIDILIGPEIVAVSYVGYDKKSFWLLSRLAYLRPPSRVRMILEYVALRIFYDFGPGELQVLADNRQIICMNEACRLYLKSHHGVSLSMDNVVPIPVPFPNSAPPPAVFSPERPVVMTAARLEEMKEYLFGMIEGAGAFFKAFPKGRLIVVGDGRYRGELESLAARYGDSVFFAGTVDPTDYLDTIRQGAVFIGMGTAAVQAAMLGLPVIIATAYDRGFSSPGYLSTQLEGNFGEEFEGQVKEIGWNLVLRLLHSPEMRTVEGIACRDHAQEFFNADRNMITFDKILGAAPTGPILVTAPNFLSPIKWKLLVKRFLINCGIR